MPTDTGTGGRMLEAILEFLFHLLGEAAIDLYGGTPKTDAPPDQPS